MIKRWIVRFIVKAVMESGLVAGAVDARCERVVDEMIKRKEFWEKAGYEHTATGWQVRKS